MEGDSALRLAISLLLVIGNAFFVAAEYALVSSRKARVDTLAKSGSKRAKRLQEMLGNVSVYVAGSQVAITMFGVGLGSVTEPFVTGSLQSLFGKNVDRGLTYAISILLVTYFVVVIGELLPKYITLSRPERIALYAAGPLRAFTTVLKPLIWIIESSGILLSKAVGIDPNESEAALRREELMLMMRAGSVEGLTDRQHAQFVSRTMQLDKLMAKDVMIHRLDIHWIEAALNAQDAIKELKELKHTRIPVCRGDIDEVLGILYINDFVKAIDEPNFTLESLVRPAIVIPESLTLDRVVLRMREEKTQIVIVADEYGGTSGLVTLEDVVEEIFGELEDSLEGERPPIEFHAKGRISARSDVRYDEVVAELVDRGAFEPDAEPSTDGLATMMIDALGRMPKLGDVVETPIGQMRVENMTRRRVMRVSIHLAANRVDLAKLTPHVQSGT